jgi:hypothetical protein
MAEWDIDSLVRIQQGLNAAYGPDEPQCGCPKCGGYCDQPVDGDSGVLCSGCSVSCQPWADA